MKNKWYKFSEEKGYRQKRPPIKKWVLVLLKTHQSYFPYMVCVGYRKDHAGDKNCPFFVTPSGSGYAVGWSDSLPDDFSWPSLDGDIPS